MRFWLTLGWPLLVALFCLWMGWWVAGLIFIGVEMGIAYVMLGILQMVETGAIVVPQHPAGDPYHQLKTPIYDIDSMSDDELRKLHGGSGGD